MSDPHVLRNWPHRTYAFDLPLRYWLGGRGPGLVVCLHGYQDHALSMVRRIGWLDADDLPFRVLAVNAPFPVPIWDADGFTDAYAWYFRDATDGFEVASPAATARGVATLIRDLGLDTAPTALFGFSQGAYLAPWLARELPSIQAIVGLGGGFPIESYAGLDHVRVDGVHGDADERVPIGPTRAQHAALSARGFRGDFHAVPDLKHRVTTVVEQLVRRLLLDGFEGRI